jgi:predicted ATPase
MREHGRAIEIVVDGTDGAGKTPCVARLCARFRRRGLAVASHAPYRVHEVYPLWATAPREAARIVVDVMAELRARSSDAEVIVWDRGWPTAYITTDDACARALFLPLPTCTVLLLSSTERTRRQARKYPQAGVWATDEARVLRYNAAYHALEAPEPRAVLRFFPDANDTYDLEAVVDAVEAAVERALVRT